MRGTALRSCFSASKDKSFDREKQKLRERYFPRHGKAAAGKWIGFHLRRARRKLCEAFMNTICFLSEADRVFSCMSGKEQV
jgi:hypothetical protein